MVNSRAGTAPRQSKAHSSHTRGEVVNVHIAYDKLSVI